MRHFTHNTHGAAAGVVAGDACALTMAPGQADTSAGTSATRARAADSDGADDRTTRVKGAPFHRIGKGMELGEARATGLLFTQCGRTTTSATYLFKGL